MHAARGLLIVVFLVPASGLARGEDAPTRRIDFNRDVRPILSNACFACHGPDARKRKGVAAPLRLDTPDGAFADLGGYAAIVPGKPDESETIRRIASHDPAEIMPPAATGKTLSPREVELLTEWVKQGAFYAKHWAYVKPTRPPIPAVKASAWAKNPIDAFLLARLEAEGLSPAPEADRPALIRRVALDLTGLPPSVEEVDRFVSDDRPDAYERAVDRLLASPAYGEHWARMWLDLARYADSAGYADDPARTIWAFRDYVVRAFNRNTPFDRFTIEQIAGDLLPNPTPEHLVATAFHRNTLTNNEGGTSDEEFRNVAVVDRVNTTMAVWMGTTMACAQCHDHKYDPLTQEEYFRLFAFFNNSEDADRTDESPTLGLESDDQKAVKASWLRDISAIQANLGAPHPELREASGRWMETWRRPIAWETRPPVAITSRSGVSTRILDDASVLVSGDATKEDVTTVDLPIADLKSLSAIRLEALPHETLPERGPGRSPGGNFVVSRVSATIMPNEPRHAVGRYVRVEIPGKQKILSLAEVQVFNGDANIAKGADARQSNTAFEGPASLAIDGNTDGRYAEAKSTTHTEISDDPWWELDLKESRPIDRVVLWNRTDNNLQERLKGFRVSILDDGRNVVWSQVVEAPPKPSVDLPTGSDRSLTFVAARADYEQPSYPASDVLAKAGRGWAVGGQTGRPHELILTTAGPVPIEAGSKVRVTIEQLSKVDGHTLGRFRVSATDDPRATELPRVPPEILAILAIDPERRSEDQRATLHRHYVSAVAPELKAERERLASLEAQLMAFKPETTVPVMKDLKTANRRKTQIQRRGNYLDLGSEVSEGVPATFPPLSRGTAVDRIALARWLVDAENPLTARVIANRYWEAIFGTGLVATSEEFGTQGDLPSHPELLDWLACDLRDGGWDLKRFLRTLVTSAAYRQDSRVSPDLVARDPDNRLLARGPRFRLSAEAIRDQALAVGGLLSPKLYGKPVKPPQPSVGLNAAFGAGIDWETSRGDDRYRRGLYTTWRRSNPYPSMTTFDAPTRDVCVVRRTRTNTPLQALVTLNDPVFIEAAQGFARRITSGGESSAEKVRLGFRIALSREPSGEELDRLVAFYEAARAEFARDPEKARRLAVEPLGPLPKGAESVELAAWTVVGNVLLNLDEFLMKR